MNPADALSAARPEKLKVEEIGEALVVVVDMVENHAKCTLQYAPLVAKRLKFLSNRLVRNPYIAATATNPPEATAGRIKLCIAKMAVS